VTKLRINQTVSLQENLLKWKYCIVWWSHSLLSILHMRWHADFVVMDPPTVLDTTKSRAIIEEIANIFNQSRR
jgi:hypothetical protein